MTTKLNETKELLKGMLSQYLGLLGEPLDKPFTCLNPEHPDAHPSMQFNSKDSQHVHCFSCSANWDIFDLIAIHELHASVMDTGDGPEPVYDFKEAYNAALRVLNVKGTPLKNDQNYDKTERLMNFKENQTSITTA